MNLDTLERDVGRHRKIAVSVFALALIAYCARYLFDSQGCRSGAAESWGQFGDFVGGILNPIIAFLAFFWLTQSVLIQRRELHETKQALLDSAKSQATQAKYAERTVKVGALGSVLDYYNNEIETLRHTIEVVGTHAHNNGWAVTPDGQSLGSDNVRPYLDATREKLKEAYDGRNLLLVQLRANMGEEA